MWLGEVIGLQQPKADTKAKGENRSGSTSSGRVAGSTRQVISPGRTIRGEVIERHGSNVKIRLPNDAVLSAKLDRDVSVSEGQVLSFQVKGTNGGLSLSPLFANTAASDNMTKALQMAGIPIDEQSLAMVEAMMRENLPIDAKSLAAMYRDITAHSDVPAADIVQLKVLNLPLTEENISQIANYKALNYELSEGLQSLGESIVQTCAQASVTAGPEESIRLLLDLLAQMTTGGAAPGGTAGGAGLILTDSVSQLNGALAQEMLSGSTADTGEAINGSNLSVLTDSVSQSGEMQIQGDFIADGTQSIPTDSVSQLAGVQIPGEFITGGKQSVLTDSVSQLGTGQPQVLSQLGTGQPQLLNQPAGEQPLETSLPLPSTPMTVAALLTASERNTLSQTLASISPELSALSQAVADGSAAPLEVFASVVSFLSASPADPHLAVSVLFDAGFSRIAGYNLASRYTLEPSDVSESERVGAVYDRLIRNLTTARSTLETAGLANSPAATLTDTALQNVDFLNQVNQLYTYIQIPLDINNRAKNADLYVYTNKKHLAAGEGTVTALLHLDMDNLGPLDVLISLTDNRVSTKFTVADDSVLDFLNEHIDILTKRLAKRGYQATSEMTVQTDRDPRSPEPSPIDQILHMGKSGYSCRGFDMRA